MDANSGLAEVSLELLAPGAEEGSQVPLGYMSFRIEEFRRPEFEVSVAVAEGAHLLQNPILVEARAAYYGGGGLTRVLPGRESVAAAGSVGLARAWLGQARRGRLSAAV